ncbi:MAG: DNA primase [Lentisphaerae bacterium GWF2_44_16]|nr:MAG: DNA primase [Lentisphaerae bacterium GWF2_44_16]
MPKISNLEYILSAAAADIVQIIGRRVPLKNKGKQWKANCPFHPDKTPSFVVTPERGIYHCFGCGKGGDAINFIREFENVEFIDAVEIAAAETGTTVQYETSGTSSPHSSHKSYSSYFPALSAAAEHYHSQLKDKSAPLEYLHKRGFTDAIIDKYKIGYSCGNSVGKVSADSNSLISAGVLSKPKETSQDQTPFDPLHGRAIIPLCDSFGRVVGFTGRLIEAKEDTAKYINTRETPVFKKGEILYGYTFARDMLRMRKKGTPANLYILEGQLKTIAAIEAGYPAVSAGGTGFTDRQLTLIYNLNPDNVYLALDPDDAGTKAALRIAPGLRNLSINTAVAELQIPEQADLPPGKIDTDDLMAAKMPIHFEHFELIEWIFRSLCSSENLNSSDALKISSVILPLINQHPNSLVREVETKKLSELTELSEHVFMSGQSHKSDQSECSAPRVPLTPGRYLCAILLADNEHEADYETGAAWFAPLIQWQLLPVALLEMLQEIINIKVHSARFGVPVISSAERLAPEKLSLYSSWLSSIDIREAEQSQIISLQKEVIKRGSAPKTIETKGN